MNGEVGLIEARGYDSQNLVASIFPEYPRKELLGFERTNRLLDHVLQSWNMASVNTRILGKYEAQEIAEMMKDDQKIKELAQDFREVFGVNIREHSIAIPIGDQCLAWINDRKTKNVNCQFSVVLMAKYLESHGVPSTVCFNPNGVHPYLILNEDNKPVKVHFGGTEQNKAEARPLEPQHLDLAKKNGWLFFRDFRSLVEMLNLTNLTQATIFEDFEKRRDPKFMQRLWTGINQFCARYNNPEALYRYYEGVVDRLTMPAFQQGQLMADEDVLPQ